MRNLLFTLARYRSLFILLALAVSLPNIAAGQSGATGSWGGPCDIGSTCDNIAGAIFLFLEILGIAIWISIVG